ncbi:MAG: hypothetical protein LLF89_03565 [Spirochaetaceae bacterium]|nr:hypothetical protein [Spirochaetaceae bacterium]
MRECNFPVGTGGAKNTRLRPVTTLAASMIIILALTFSTACSKGYSRFMKLPADPVASSGIGWAMVNTAYAKLRAGADANSAQVAVVRGGTVFQCPERKIDPRGADLGGLWYRYKDSSAEGWIHGSDIQLFSTEEQATKAAQLFK